MRLLLRLICLTALISLPFAVTAQAEPSCSDIAADAADAFYCECLERDDCRLDLCPKEADKECALRAMYVYKTTFLACVCPHDCDTKEKSCSVALDCWPEKMPPWYPPVFCDPCLTAKPTRGCRVNGVLGICRGGPGTDVMLGTSGRDVMFGRGGEDYMVGFEKADLLCGGPGDDVLIGNGGGDTLSGQGGDDILEGMGGRDALDGGPGNDKLRGGGNVDTCTDPNDGNQTYLFQSCEITP